MAHGILDFCGLKDKTEEEKERMRDAEEKCMNDFVGLLNYKFNKNLSGIANSA